MSNIEAKLRGLILNASEIKNLTGWPASMIEDYLNILDNLITIASDLDDTYLPDNIFGDDFIGVTDNGDGSVTLDNEGMVTHVNFMSSLVGAV